MNRKPGYYWVSYAGGKEKDKIVPEIACLQIYPHTKFWEFCGTEVTASFDKYEIISGPLTLDNQAIRPWPNHWPKYAQGREACDMLVGPCACGAWHKEGEFEFKKELFWDRTTDDLYDYKLYRNGKEVISIPDYIYESNKG